MNGLHRLRGRERALDDEPNVEHLCGHLCSFQEIALLERGKPANEPRNAPQIEAKTMVSAYSEMVKAIPPNAT